MIGYFDPSMSELTGEISRLLRLVFGTTHAMTLPVSGTGTAGMEAALINLLEPGDTALLACNGYFGDRMVQIAERCGAVPVKLEAEWGRPILPEQIEAAFKQAGRATVLGAGACRDLHGRTAATRGSPPDRGSVRRVPPGRRGHESGRPSGGGGPARRGRVLLRYPEGAERADGLSPITVSDRAMERIRKRPRKLQSFYLDLAMFEQYWTGNPYYHHTPPTTFHYALLEALRIVEEEGLAARWNATD